MIEWFNALDKVTGFRIINACEARDAEILAKINRPWWRLF